MPKTKEQIEARKIRVAEKRVKIDNARLALAAMEKDLQLDGLTPEQLAAYAAVEVAEGNLKAARQSVQRARKAFQEVIVEKSIGTQLISPATLSES